MLSSRRYQTLQKLNVNETKSPFKPHEIGTVHIILYTYGFDTSDQGLSRQIGFFGVTWRTDCKYSNISMVRLTHDAT